MLTLRSRWLLAIGVLMIALGLGTERDAEFVARPGLLGAIKSILSLFADAQWLLIFLGLGIVLWITGEGLLFLYRVRCVVRNLRLRRTLHDDRGPVTSFWAGRTFEVQARLVLDGGYLPYLAFEEMTPFGLEVTSGETHSEGAISDQHPLEIRYKVKAARPGCVRFEGVKVQLADLHGFFYHVAFVRREQIYRVLPALVDAEGKTAASKRYNLLPPPGIHRLTRPGAGSELLDLRDYLPGDPPKTIAWKVSARRDRLITKEYESEVPIRCTLFIDTSESVRLGPPGKNALTRLIEIASGVAQANLGSRDMTGLCLFDEERTRILKPARTKRHLLQVFNQLADAAGLAPAAGTASVDLHLRLAHAFAQEVYPEQLAAGVNHVPGWLPFFVPIPGHWVTPRTLATHFYRKVICTGAALIYLMAGLIVFAELADGLDAIPDGVRDELLWSLDALDRWALELGDRSDTRLLEAVQNASGPMWQIAFLIVFFLGFPVWLMLWRDALPLLFSPRRRRITRMRKRMAALLSMRYGLGGGGLELLLQDDRQMGVYLERFLNEHHIPHTPELFDRKGRYLFASPAKVNVLSAALLRAIGKGHDNELFVLFVDLVELQPHLEPLIKAVKVALARHHQVMLVIPWPPDLEPPGRDEEERRAQSAERGARNPEDGKKLAPRSALRALRSPDVKAQLKQLTAKQYVKAFHRARRAFARLQVPVVCAADDEFITLILDRIDRLRGVRRRR